MCVAHGVAATLLVLVLVLVLVLRCFLCWFLRARVV